jgi:hypothetical protein
MKYFAMATALILVLVISGCTQSGLIVNDFYDALDDLEINNGKMILEMDTTSYTVAGLTVTGRIDGAWSSNNESERNVTISLVSLATNNQASESHEDNINDLINDNFSVSQVLISDEIIDKTEWHSPIASTLFYMWTHNNFVFFIMGLSDNMGLEDTDTNIQPVLEAIIDVYK